MDKKRLFLGIKQVLKTTFDTLSLEEKVGYVWFVRNIEDNHLEIYLGSIKYADTNESVASQEYVDTLIEKLRTTIGLDENLDLPQEFDYETIIEAINDLFNVRDELLMQMSSLTENVETLRDEVIDNEHVTSESILTIKDLIGITNNFTFPYDFAHYNTIIEGINDRYRKAETYSKDEIHRLISGTFRFKGTVEYISDLGLIPNPINGDVYMVEKKSIENPVVINSEFVWTTDEFGLYGEWLELGPLFDYTILDAKFDAIKDAVGLTDDLTLPEDFKHNSVIDAINTLNDDLQNEVNNIYSSITTNVNELSNDVNNLQEQIDIVVSGLPKTHTVNFYLDDETYSNPQFICQTTIKEGDCLIDYPTISSEDYSDYAYWDTDIIDLHSILNDVNVSFVTTIINRVKNPQLLNIVYNQQLCEDYNYMKLSEASSVNDEQWFKLSNTLKYVTKQSDPSVLIEVTGEIYNKDGKLMENYNLYNWEVYDGDETMVLEDENYGFYTFDLNGNKIEFKNYTYALWNEFFTLENFDEFQYFTNVNNISFYDNKNTFNSFNCSKIESIKLPNSIKKIETDSFFYCINLSSITIPDSVTSIGECAFQKCSSLTSINIPSSVIEIGDYCFSECTSLTSITLNWTDSDSILTFNSNWGLPTVPSYYIYPDGLEELYYEKGWPSQFTLECVVHNGTVEITPSATTYQYGAEVTLTVTPIEGQEFLGWDDMNMDNPRTITITGNTYLEAFCTSYVYHTITIGEVQNGTLDVDKTTAKVGDTIKITQNPDYGYQNPDTRDITVLASSGQTIDVQLNKLGEYTFTMPDDDVTITSIFPPIQVNVTFIANNCTIKCGDDIEVQDTEGTYTKAYNSEISIDVTPNEGYQFTQWADGDTSNPRTEIITSIEPITFEATCSKNTVVQEAVDLGLPSGTLWANMNVGATAPEEYGNYYAWGETETKDTYTWDNYEYGTQNNLTKYNATDGLTTLEATDDAATVNWGGNWRMPTDIELTELIENCTWTWTDNYNGTGVAGQIVTSNTNSNSIFIPAAGLLKDILYFMGSNGYYWSSSLKTTQIAQNVHLSSSNVSIDFFNGDRYIGVSVRPVKTPQPTTQIYYNAASDLSTTVSSTLGSVNLVVDTCTYDNTTGDGVLTYDGDVSEITTNYFSNKTQLRRISLPDSVTSIGNDAFYGCSSLTSITIPNFVTSIGNSALGNCSSLISVIIPNSVTRIEYGAFTNCTSLNKVILGNSITYIGEQCFGNCPLTSITLPDSLKEFGDSSSVVATTFYNSQFEEITIPKNIETIYDKSAPIKNNNKLKKIIWNVSSSSNVFNPSNGATLSNYDSEVTELEFGENVVFIPLLIKVFKKISKITCKSLVAPTTESGAISTMAATNGELHVKTGSDYSSLLSELGSGWTIVYDVE